MEELRSNSPSSSKALTSVSNRVGAYAAKVIRGFTGRTDLGGQSAEDFAQEAMHMLWASGRLAGEEHEITNRACQVVRNRIIDALRSAHVKRERTTSSLDAECQSSADESLSSTHLSRSGLVDMARALMRKDQLARKYIDAVLMASKSSPRIIARDLNVNPRCIYNARKRIRRRLCRSLELDEAGHPRVGTLLRT